MRLLLVEDDPLLGDGLAAGLTQVGYCVEWIREGQQALKAIRSDKFELIVLDLGLPGVDGMDILKKIRSQKDNTPILILTARDVLQDRIDGLDNGADDYLVPDRKVGKNTFQPLSFNGKLNYFSSHQKK